MPLTEKPSRAEGEEKMVKKKDDSGFRVSSIQYSDAHCIKLSVGQMVCLVYKGMK